MDNVTEKGTVNNSETQSNSLTEQVTAAEIKLDQSARQLDSSPPVVIDPKPKLGDPGVEPGITDPNVIAGAISGRIDSEMNKPVQLAGQGVAPLEEDKMPDQNDPNVKPGITDPGVIAGIMGKTIEDKINNPFKVGGESPNNLDQKPISELKGVIPQGS
jgi:hypothetical protein